MRFPIDSPFRGPVKDSPLWKVLTSGVFAGSLLFLISAGLDATPVAAQRINPRTAQENPTQDPNWLTSPTTSVTEVITPGQEIVIPLELSNSTTQIQAYETTLKPGEICLAGSKRSGEVSALADTSIPMTVMPDCLQSGAHHYELEIQNPMGSGRITIPIDIQVGDVITRITFDPTQISETVPYRDDTRFSVILNNPTATNQPFTGELESVGTSANCITGLPEDDVLLSGQSLEYILTVQKECLPEGTN
ncbi:hypothetical protein KA082_02695, partial [Candidatus Woesebacteria bacterium]|nr:hypothetical protein [Candidatus Woesebacteria bacterium]